MRAVKKMINMLKDSIKLRVTAGSVDNFACVLPRSFTLHFVIQPSFNIENID